MVHRFSVQTRLSYQFLQDGWLLLNVAAIRNLTQTIVHEELTNSLDADFVEKGTLLGGTRFHGLSVPAGPLEVSYTAEVEKQVELVEAADPPEAPLVALPPEVVRYLYPSRYCESDKLTRFAAKEFGFFQPGHERVAGICNWIYSNVEYVVGSTDAHTSAVDCFTQRSGVCRDFAHLGIALCRALGIPARYASAYAYELPVVDFHALFEVWLGDRWWYYDPTRSAPQEGFVLVGYGHDAADTSVATLSAGALLNAVTVGTEKLSDGPVNYSIGPVSFG